MIEKLVLRPREAQAALGIKNTKFWELVKTKQIETRKIGGATVVPADSLKKFVDNLPKEFTNVKNARSQIRGSKGQIARHG